MAVFKCKICGGNLDVQAGMSVCECEYCGTRQTLPKIKDDRRANLYDRANHFRRNNEFDKAMSMYEQILEEDREDAEAYWSLVLCTYGIEYVEDPASHIRKPTVNRTQFTSVFADENYKAALKYADENQRKLYEEEARQIDGIQKGILDISGKEAPFDVFICYKETDAEGRRTQDSVLANDLYHQLTQEGFKVFFARITLEDKLGSAYEPYIFAALNSAKVMVVLGTRAEYFNAVWVRNEWSRYLSLIKGGAKKVLVPAYKDMDPYDLPQEFSHLQSQDMGKLGFMQDLIRGIRKLTGADQPAQPAAAAGTSGNEAAALLKRAFLFMEDGDFARGDEYCERVLNMDPENGEAYLGKLMVQLKVRKRENLAQNPGTLEQTDAYRKVMRFGSDAVKRELEGYNQQIIRRQQEQQEKQREDYYQETLKMLEGAVKSSQIQEVINRLKNMGNYKDAAEKIAAATEKLAWLKKKKQRKAAKLGMILAAAVIIVAVSARLCEMNKLFEDVANYAMRVLLFVLPFLSALFLERLAAARSTAGNNGVREPVFTIRKIAMIGMFFVIAMILQLFVFPLPFSELPILIGSFAFGPMAGVVMEFVKILLKLCLQGTNTAFVGEFASFVIGCSFILPASAIYTFRKSKKRAVAACVVGMFVMSVFCYAVYRLPAIVAVVTLTLLICMLLSLISRKRKRRSGEKQQR